MLKRSTDLIAPAAPAAAGSSRFWGPRNYRAEENFFIIFWRRAGGRTA